jgi:coenzyme F420-reducing hydrogenase delta subunit
MCSGRVDLTHVFHAFSKGADGLFIVGCHLGECNYITNGNYHALSTVHLAKKILEHVGLNPERLIIEFLSGGEGIRFADAMTAIQKKIKSLGPLGKSEGIEESGLKAKLAAVTRILPFVRLVERESLRILDLKTEEEFEAFFNSEETNRIFREMVAEKLSISEIMALLREGPRSGGEISEILGLKPSEVSRHVNMSARQGLVIFDESQRVMLALTEKERARA